ncbi:MAG: hypothetical protein JWR80_8535 [Bradyrhizobium sp.]|nr:hypothetical protein [Bradyrhizobium sp.]
MGTLHSIRGGATALPLPVMLATIPSMPRPILARLVARMIDRIDEIDGDTDREANGDELDGSMAEDDFHGQNTNWMGYPGDPGDAEDGDEDCCEAGDDGVRSGASPGGQYQDYAGNEDDGEPEGAKLLQP